jgi:hypothetical protein
LTFVASGRLGMAAFRGASTSLSEMRKDVTVALQLVSTARYAKISSASIGRDDVVDMLPTFS